MDNVTLIGVDLAKRVFHLHGAAGNGPVVFGSGQKLVVMLRTARRKVFRQGRRLW